MTAWIEVFLMDNPMLMEQVVSVVVLMALGLLTRFALEEGIDFVAELIWGFIARIA